MAAANLSRRFLIDVRKDGTISSRDTNELLMPRRLNNSALPVFSVSTLEAVAALEVRFGRRQYAVHPETGQVWYRLCTLEDGTDPALRGDGLLEFDDLPGIERMFAKFYDEFINEQGASK